MSSYGIDLSVFLKMVGDLKKPLKEAEGKIKSSTERMKNNMKLSLKLAGVGAVAQGIKMASAGLVSNFTESYKEVQRASGELRSLGMTDIKAVIAEGQKLQNTYVGLTTEAFVRAAYDIKSGVGSLTDEGVAAMTSAALIVAKATKGVPEEMTSLFATSYGIFKKQFADMSDADFGEFFGASLAKSVQQFKTEGSKMQQAIETAGAGATNLGMSMIEQMTLLGMMQQQMQAGDAGTALKSFATNAAAAEEAFVDLAKFSGNPVRVRVLDANGKLRAMADILTDLKARYGETIDDLSGQEMAEIKDAFGTDEAMKLINALYGQEEAVKANAKALEEAAEAGEEYTKKMAADIDDYDGAGWAKFNQNLKSLKDDIGAGLLPVLDKLATALKPITEAFGTFISQNPELVAGFGAFVVALGGIATVVAPIFLSIATLTTSFASLTFSLSVLKTGIIATTRVLMANPIGLAVAAIAASAYLIYEYWEPIKGFFLALWEGVKSFTMSAWEGIKSAFLNYTPASLIITHWDSITSYFSSLWEGVKSFTVSAWEGIKSAFLNYTPHGLIITHWDSITSYFSSLWDQVKSTFTTKWEEIKASTLTWTSDFMAIGSSILTGLANGITGGVQAVIDTITGIGSSIVGTFKSILGIASPSKIFSDFGGFLMDGLIGGLKAKIAAVKDAINGIGSSVVGWFKEKLGIASPSKVFAGLGGHLSEGLAVGIERQKGLVIESMEGLRRDLARPMIATAMLGASGALSASPATASPLITPDFMSAAHAGSADKQMSIEYKPTYSIEIAGGLGRGVEETIRRVLEEHDRDFKRDLERYLND